MLTSITAARQIADELEEDGLRDPLEVVMVRADHNGSARDPSFERTSSGPRARLPVRATSMRLGGSSDDVARLVSPKPNAGSSR